MKPIVKYSALAAGLAVALLAVAAVILVSVVDTDFIKAEAAKAVRERTGRELTFGGDVRLSFFPWLGVELDHVALSNAPGFGEAPMAELGEVDVKVRLLPLLSGQVQVGDVLVRGLVLRLARDASGRASFDDIRQRLAAPEDAPAQPAASPQTPAGPPALGALGALRVGALRLADATLIWDDQQSGTHYAVTGLNLTTGPLAPGQPLDLALKTALSASDPALEATVDLTTRLDPGPDFTTPALHDLTLTVEATGQAVPGGAARITLTGALLADLAADTLTARGLTLAAYGLKAAGEATIARYSTAPALDAVLTLDTFNPKALMAALGLDPVATTDPAALTSAALAVRAKATREALALSDLRLSVDDTSLTGQASVDNFARPALRFALAATALDADRYMPPAQAPGGGKGTPGAPGAGTPPAPSGQDGSGLPMEQLRALDVNGTLDVAALTVAKIRMSDVHLTVTAKDGVLRVSPLSAGLYGGLLKAGLTADVRGQEPKTSLDLGLAGMGLGGLLADLTGQDKVTGTTALDLTLAATGQQWKTMVRSLSGKGAVALTDGAFKGFQIIPEAVRAQAVASDPQRRVEKAERQQRFKDISATFAIAKGVLTTSDTTLSADNLKGQGRGAVDLGAETIDYKAVVDVTAMPRIPFTVRGALTDPSVSLDSAEFVKGLAQGVLGLPGKAGQGVLDTGKGALEGLGSGLRNLLGGGRNAKDGQENTQP